MLTEEKVATVEKAGGVLNLFSRHGLAGLVIGALFLMHGYTLFCVNKTMIELIMVSREMKTLIQERVR
jgi:hypothetical protein